MKEFVKWLGVNEKIAKVAVWLLIIMVFLIVLNTSLECLGFPNYAITYDNIVKLNPNKLIDTLTIILLSLLNFYSVVLLVFGLKETKKTFKYALLYIILNWIVKIIFGYMVMQVFIILFDIVFCYLYSGKKPKYILYAIISYIVVVLLQGVWYVSKARFINYSKLNYTTRSILSLDYYIIIILIILVKEIYLKKRGEIKCQKYQDVSYGLENSKKKTNLQKKSQRKSQKQSNKNK